MAHRTAKKPDVSVLLAVRDASDEVVRSAESVLSQSMRAVELIIADCTAAESTRAAIDRLVDRDIRVESVSCGGSSVADGLRAALSRARAPRALVMREGDWLGPGYLEQMRDAAVDGDADLVISSVSVDAARRDGDRSSSVIAHPDHAWATARDFHRAAAELLADGGLSTPAGKLVRTDLAREAWSALPAGAASFELALACLRDVERARVLRAPVYHVALGRPSDRAAAFDPDLYPACERRHGELLDLLGAWGLIGDAGCMEPVHRMHLAGVIRCIENASLGAGKLSSIERRERVQDMIDAPSTRESVRALAAYSRDFGLMFAPIARRSASACCMGARLTDIIGRALTPLARPVHVGTCLL